MVASVPIRLMVENDVSFAALAKTARRSVLRAITHADAPFHVVRAAAGGQPFDIMLNLLSFPRPDELDDGWMFKPVAPATSRFNCTFYTDWTRNGGSITLVRDPSRISDEYASILLAQLLHLLRQTALAPNQSVGALDLMPGVGERRDQLLAMPLPFDGQASPVVDILRSARTNPTAAAVEQGGRCWSYAELDRCSATLARSLLQLACERSEAPKGVVVVLRGERSFGLVATVLAALRAGIPFFLADPLLPPERARTYQRQLGRVITVAIGDRCQAPNDLVVDAVTASTSVENVGDDRLIDGAGGLDPAYVVFTSGTTGDPKAILGTHAGLAHFVRWQRDTFAIRAPDRIPVITGLSFDVVLRELLTPLSGGAALCLPAAAGAVRGGMLAWLAEAQITVLHAVPSLARRWLGESTGIRLPSLRAIFFAGETLTRELAGAWIERAPQAAIVNLFGPSETTLAKCFDLVSPSSRHERLPVGRPLPQTQVFIDREGHAAAIGEIGEIVLRTPYRSLGYVNPGPAPNPFRRNPMSDDENDLLYWTGDLGRFLCGGTVQLIGRRDRQVKIRGVRVEPDEIATIIRQQAGVIDAAVLYDQVSQKLVAFVVTKTLIRSLLESLRERLPSAMVPSRFARVVTIPVTANGKVDYRALAAMPDVEDQIADRPGIELDDPIAATIVDHWRRYVSSGVTGMDDDFLQVGGNSLDLIELHASLCQAFGRELNLASFFRTPTLRNLCELALRDDVPVNLERRKNPSARTSTAARRRRAREDWLEKDGVR
jgi:amino acid adenylation domain-containing protein